METRIIPLPDFRIPDYPDEPLTLDAQPLSIIEVANSDTTTTTTTTTENNTTTPTITPAIGISTILHSWHPNALSAFLDLDAWFSMTWSLIPSTPTPAPSTNTTTTPTPRLEIGRISSQITFGTLSPNGSTWSLMLTYTLDPTGAWLPNPKESMRGDVDLTSADEIETLAREWVDTCIANRVWETNKGVKHTLHVEYAPMDVWGDGVPMNPHWLYEALTLEQCTTCRRRSGVGEGQMLQRCGRCGTATYCSGACQRVDWKVHKFVCTMGLQDRGQMLKVQEKGGFVGWDAERTFAVEGEGVKSANCHFSREGVLKRCRSRGMEGSGGDVE
ncbi:hypothetical protein T440DRAFT_502426 [Plenodomus tracheiphilus IPT5]|uniref:MYND-type domain-containing protein n=1 Tax=Plenodomus tracheiphilus IPT5 TaxID=1408161 RepID=A0A6A7AQ83_9PLEO|nr:hypothetical protein T440DRAFT_502426 [Plenodomus tracheiphilus IPT5]